MFFLFNSFGYADSTRRTDEATEVTADALGAYQTWTAKPPPILPRRGEAFEDDGLMTAVVAGNLTASATDTQFLVELRIDDGVAVQTVGMQKLLQALANQLLQLRDTTLGHIAL